MACIVSKVFIKNDMKVKKGERLLVLRAPLPPPRNPPMSLSSPMLESDKRRIKKILKDQLKPARTKKHSAAKKRARAAVKKHAAEVGAAAAEKGAAASAPSAPEYADNTPIPMETAASAPSAPEDADNTPIPMETSPTVDKMEAVKLDGIFKKFDTVKKRATAKKRAAEVGAAAAEKGAGPSAPPPLEDADNPPIPMETSLAVDKMEAAKLYENFKKFDTVIDHSDHYFSAQAIPDTQQLPTDWVNRIQQERRILEEHLPDTIYVRVYESRMAILRAAIIGQKGTPYHDGLFFFDVCFPSNYPCSPPLVHYRSCGVSGINPNMNKHDVRLIFQNANSKQEKMWSPRTSNMLQLLVCIQSLIFNARPYFNGLANAKLRGNVNAERWSFLFNENTVVKSLKTMTYIMNKPPKNFEDLVVGHFHRRVHVILRACRDYWNDWKTVPCLVGDENHKRSIKFVRDIASCSKPLLEAFNRIGAKDAQKYLYLTEFKISRAKVPANVTEDINIAANGKRKMEGDNNDANSKKKKVTFAEAGSSGKEKVDVYSRHSKVTVRAPMSCRISEVFATVGMQVEIEQPLFALERTFEDLLIDSKIKKSKAKQSKAKRSKTAKLKDKNSAMRMIVLANRCSRVGIFCMEDVLVEKVQEDNNPMAVGLGKEEVDVLKSYENFKKFDRVMDMSDHHFSAEKFAVTPPPEEWTNKIHEEWVMLENQLPETIFVRVNESRMDLLRAVIIGRQGTPYRNGLFFFDVCFPSNYPDSPPLVHYHSGGLRICPNLQKCGKVDLSIPKTTGGQETTWVPGTSTILDLLVSIQNRILTTNPLYNSLTYAIMRGSAYGNLASEYYNENSIVKSLKTMVHVMNRPPKSFEKFVVGHFHNRARAIMVTCSRRTPSITFRNDLALCKKLLLAAFNKIGAEIPEEVGPSS
uniref:uncharacterized protein LOC122606735 n=1 Tax=Erigeron canadensis TaxID=72917 RepID=UPI001CB93F1C|nr:uncharacterized protein LOC122606735 [Erigeron canadensis]